MGQQVRRTTGDGDGLTVSNFFSRLTHERRVSNIAYLSIYT